MWVLLLLFWRWMSTWSSHVDCWGQRDNFVPFFCCDELRIMCAVVMNYGPWMMLWWTMHFQQCCCELVMNYELCIMWFSLVIVWLSTFSQFYVKVVSVMLYMQNFLVWLSIFDVFLCKVQLKCCPKFNRNGAQFFLSYVFHCYNFCRRIHIRTLFFITMTIS